MRGWKLALAPVAVVAVIALAAAFLTGGGSGQEGAKHPQVSTFTAADRSFSVAYPAGWHATAVGQGAGLIERADHRGLVLVRERPALRGRLSALVKDLPAQLRKRFKDFRPVGAGVARLSTGPAVVYTFVRAKTNRVQSIVVAPAPAVHRSFTLEVAAPVKAAGAVRQAGEIVRSLTAR
jgi:hypothetical protein